FFATVALLRPHISFDDTTFTNRSWTEVSGIPLEELNRIEKEFLNGINFKLHVTEKEFLLWLQLLGHYWNREVLSDLTYKSRACTSPEYFISNRSYWKEFLNTSPKLSPCSPFSKTKRTYSKKAKRKLNYTQIGTSNIVDIFSVMSLT
ncbi:hypothetical protein K7432_017024, partial [Basidiobolus ranarum]